MSPPEPHVGMAPEMLEAWSADEGVDRAAGTFRDRFGAEPDGVWSAPGRVNLIGEHTDYNGGLCLPIALPHRTYVALSRAADDTLRLTSAQEEDTIRTHSLRDIRPGSVDGWVAYVAGVAWAMRQEPWGESVGAFAAAVDSRVPYGAGLSSSAALECAVAVGLDEVYAAGQANSAGGRARLAAACVRAENEVVGAATGGMDQSAAMHSRPGAALLIDTRSGEHRSVPFDLVASGLALVVVDTRASHQLSDGQYGQRRATCDAAAAQLGVETLREVDPASLEGTLELLTEDTLADGSAVTGDVVRRRVRHVVTESARVEEFVALLETGRLREVGPAMDASHASLRDDYEVSCRELDLVVEAARAAGALGARMTGGGFGGSAIALVDAGRVGAVTEAVARAFAEAGLRAPGFIVAEPAGAAARDH